MNHYRNLKAYLEKIRLIQDHFRSNPVGATVKLFWQNPSLTESEWRREFRDALHRRINAKVGEHWRNQYGLKEVNYIHDRIKLTDARRQIRHPGSGFTTRVMQRRFPDVHDWMRYRDF